MARIGDLDMSYEVAGCLVCGQIYANILPNSDIYTQYYSTMSKYDQAKLVGDFSSSDFTRTSAYVTTCRPFLSHQAVIADIGCGSGYLLHRFKQEGWTNVFGIDPAPQSSHRASMLFGIDTVKQGVISEASALIDFTKVELVCLTGVLEHLYSPRQELRTLFNLLLPGTLVLMDVPALDRFENERYEPLGELSIEHIQWYSAKSFENLVRALGAETISLHIEKLDSSAVCDSVIGLFRIREQFESSEPANSLKDIGVMESYLSGSTKILQVATDSLSATPGPWIVYGAGSHTARLLPLLSKQNIDDRVAIVVDSNLNIQGKTLGRWSIESPSQISSLPSTTPILISSFRSQKTICDDLSRKYPNPLICLYANDKDF
jgi:SAM-dependent methyltransferase